MRAVQPIADNGRVGKMCISSPAPTSAGTPVVLGCRPENEWIQCCLAATQASSYNMAACGPSTLGKGYREGNWSRTKH
jgi:hypothetical protein